MPGLQVRKLDANTWAITARAVAGRYSSKLLVMVDGQSVYDPVHAGVNWESLRVPLYNIEKIEIVRGQGGLLWRSNATNGVVNIITKQSEDTRGVTFWGQAGDVVEHDISGQYGSDIQSLGAYRVYAFKDKTDSSDRTLIDTIGHDSSHSKGLGGRVDLNLRDDLFLMLKGDYRETNHDNTSKGPDPMTHARTYFQSTDERTIYSSHLKLEHLYNQDTTQTFQLSYAEKDSDSFYDNGDQKRFDTDYQINMMLGAVRLDFGLNYRHIHFDIDETDYVSNVSGEDAIEQYGAFMQVQFDLIPEELKLVIGNKSEHNSMTDWEHQPLTRLVWLPHPQHTLWLAYSRGVRIPSIAEHDLKIQTNGVAVSSIIGPTGNPGIDNYHLERYLVGGDDIEAETSDSIESGYRFAGESHSVDLSLFYTESDNVLSVGAELTPYSVEELMNNPALLAGGLGMLAIEQSFHTDAELETYGGELVFGWNILPELKTELGYSYTRYDYTIPNGNDFGVGFDTNLQQWMAKTIFSLSKSHSFYTKLNHEKGEAYSTDDFVTVDMSWSWKITPEWQFNLTGNNLFDGRKLEYSNLRETYTLPSYIEPSVVARIIVEL